MKKALVLLSVLLVIFKCFPLTAVDSTFMDYQNYNHGYCPECSCYPCRCSAGNPPVENVENPDSCATCGDPAPQEPCAKPDPCNPAPVCGTQCGMSMCFIGLTLALMAAAGAIIISTGNGHPVHN